MFEFPYLPTTDEVYRYRKRQCLRQIGSVILKAEFFRITHCYEKYRDEKKLNYIEFYRSKKKKKKKS